MPVWHYSVKEVDEERTAKAMSWDQPVSLKEAYEIMKIIRGMRLNDAIDFLKKVIRKETPVPYVRYKRKVAHKRGLAKAFPKWKTPIGRYPVKTAEVILKLLENVRNNAENKNLDVDSLVIIHIAAHKGPVLKRYMPRAFGRATPKFGTTIHMEVIVKEVLSQKEGGAKR